jgi:MarR family transcriptional regulator for hemolysin
MRYNLQGYRSMAEPQPERSIGFLIADVARLISRNFDRRAQKFELSRAQWQVLAWLKRNEGISQTGLADILEMSPMTLMRHVDKLEASGLVERRPHPADRRIYKLYLGRQGQSVLDRLWALGAETRNEALSGISRAEEDALLKALSRMRQNLIEAENGALAPAPLARKA